ncbi:carboxypeptidase-like regulatory domain-containing protein [Glycomyces salinus]|uniref:carboxypeptidase-like regulatory domain-containing protein n=1 Tax=Glycomyces salinus TaxID=980294 RepID=UPI0018EC2D0F|nr:carboxypeptidase-like regulatory domain-containing protein [Glycomyces salinus]
MTTGADPSRTQTSVSRSRHGLRGRLRTRLALLAALVGVALGAFTLPAAAQAQDGKVLAWMSSGQNPFIDIGGSAAMVTITVQPNFQVGDGPRQATITASLEGLDGYVGVDTDGGQCTKNSPNQVTCSNITAQEGQRTIQFTLAPAVESDLPEGETKTGKLKLQYGGDAKGKEETDVKVAGHAQAGVSSITGKVTSNADPVPDAKVVLNDGDGTDHETSTNDGGEFSFPAGGETIAPGEMTLTISKDGYEDESVEFEVPAGGTNNRNLTLTEVEEDEPVEETTAVEETTEAATEEATPAAAEDEGGISGTLLVLIIVGALLVIGGIIGIVLLLRGGKDDKDDDDGEGFPTDAPPEHSPTAAQVGSPGVYQAGPSPAGDAPTMVHNGPLVSDNEVGAYGAPTAFGPAYGAGAGSDSTQVMPQAGAQQPPPPPAAPPAVGPDGTQLLPTVKNTGGPGAPGAPSGPGGADATQVMPQANLGSPPPASAPPSAFGDPAATRPHPSPTPSPTPPPSTGPRPSPSPSPGSAPRPSMFEPPSQPSAPPPGSRDPYAPQQQPSQPPMPPQPSPQRPPQPGTGSFGAPGSRDPYAPPPEPSAPPTGPYTPAPTQAVPQSGPGFGADRQPSPYAPDGPDHNQWPGRDDAADQGTGPDQSYRPDEERRGWGEWDDRPRSW